MGPGGAATEPGRLVSKRRKYVMSDPASAPAEELERLRRHVGRQAERVANDAHVLSYPLLQVGELDDFDPLRAARASSLAARARTRAGSRRRYPGAASARSRSEPFQKRWWAARRARRTRQRHRSTRSRSRRTRCRCRSPGRPRPSPIGRPPCPPCGTKELLLLRRLASHRGARVAAQRAGHAQPVSLRPRARGAANARGQAAVCPEKRESGAGEEKQSPRPQRARATCTYGDWRDSKSWVAPNTVAVPSLSAQCRACSNLRLHSPGPASVASVQSHACAHACTWLGALCRPSFCTASLPSSRRGFQYSACQRTSVCGYRSPTSMGRGARARRGVRYDSAPAAGA